MKYQYNPESGQTQSKIKYICIRLFLFGSLFGIIYEGFKFFQEKIGDNPNRGPDQYCGNSTCYQLLNVQRDADSETIKKSYRLLARTYHPDKSKQQNAIQIFQYLNKAYETLMDEKSRFIYDLYLNNPDQSDYLRQFEYYNKKYIENPQIPVSAVFFGIVICISALQYVMRKQMYEKAIQRIAQSHDFKIKVNQKCNNNKKSKEAVKQQMMQQIQIEGGLAKPTYKDIFGYKLILSPWTFILWVKSWIFWIALYWILRRPYNQEAQVYLTKKALSIQQRQWSNLAQEERRQLLKRQLWIEQNKKKFTDQKRRQWLQELKINNPGRYNMTLKYMRQNNIKFQ